MAIISACALCIYISLGGELRALPNHCVRLEEAACWACAWGGSSSQRTVWPAACGTSSSSAPQPEDGGFKGQAQSWKDFILLMRFLCEDVPGQGVPSQRLTVCSL